MFTPFLYFSNKSISLSYDIVYCLELTSPQANVFETYFLKNEIPLAVLKYFLLNILMAWPLLSQQFKPLDISCNFIFPFA